MFVCGSLVSLVAAGLLSFVSFPSDLAPAKQAQLIVVLRLLTKWYGWSTVAMGAAFLIIQAFLVRYAATRQFASTSLFSLPTPLRRLHAHAWRTYLHNFPRVTLIVIGSLAMRQGNLVFVAIFHPLWLVVPGFLVGLGRAILEPSLLSYAVDQSPPMPAITLLLRFPYLPTLV